MASELRLLALLGSMLLCSGVANAQDTPDLLGIWTVSVTGYPDDPQCGEKSATGEAHVARKIAARAYRGTIRFREVFSKCKRTFASESVLTVRIRANKVTVEYDEEGWHSDSLLLNGDEMSGTDSSGVAIHWIRQTVAETVDAPLGAAEVADLESLLGDVKPRLEVALRKEFGSQLQRGIAKSGLEEEEVGQVVERTLDRMTSCVLDSVRDMVRVQGIPLEDTVVVLDPRRMDFQNMKCVQDAAQNAGVRIR